MRLRQRLAAVIRDWLRPDTPELRLVRQAFAARFVKRATFGECLSRSERVELLTSLIREVPKGRHTEFLEEA